MLMSLAFKTSECWEEILFPGRFDSSNRFVVPGAFGLESLVVERGRDDPLTVI
jgi:hypothetical protein